MKLVKIMSPVDVHYKPSDSLISVVKSLAKNHHSCGLICEYDKPMGIITEQDIVRLFSLRTDGQIDENIAISEVMTHKPICVYAETDLVDALDLSKTRNLRHLPVIDSTQRLIGIVTQTDMTKAFLASVLENHKLTKENHRLHILSIEDPLTGLPNRRAMEIDLRHTAAVAQRRSSPYSIALIDIDWFKNFNDHYGHLDGDKALIHIPHLLKANLRESDKVFRYGGEEFVFLMPFTSIEGALIATQRLNQLIDEDDFPHVESPFGHITASIGVACSYESDWKQTLDEADSALYEAKDEGRNRGKSAEFTPPADSEFLDLNLPELPGRRPRP